MSEQNCPKCGEECCRESADVGVGVIYGPWGCICGWSSCPEYDRSDGISPAQQELGDDFYVDSTGTVHSVERIANTLKRFGIPEETTKAVFKGEI